MNKSDVIVVYTANVNGFDNLRTPACPTEHNVRYLCFTNLPIELLPRVEPWEYVALKVEGSGARTSRMPKILAHRFVPDAAYSIWHDCNYQLRKSPNEIIDEVCRDVNWMAHRHPCRTCIYEEAEVVMDACPLIPRDEVVRQISGYREAGFPEKAGLWANGFIARRHTPEVARLNEEWWRLFSAGCERDQLSFPVARRNTNTPIKTIDANVFSSPYMLYRWHAAWRDKDDNPNFWKQRDELRRQLKAASIYGFPDY